MFKKEMHTIWNAFQNAIGKLSAFSSRGQFVKNQNINEHQNDDSIHFK